MMELISAWSMSRVLMIETISRDLMLYNTLQPVKGPTRIYIA